MARVFPRAAQKSRHVARVWVHSENSVETWLEDRVWLLARVPKTGPGPDCPVVGQDGQPLYEQMELGPYAGKLAAPVNREAYQPDRNVMEEAGSLAIMSDVRPHEKMRVRVQKKGGGPIREYRIEGTVNPRFAAWGPSVLWQCEVIVISEH